MRERSVKLVMMVAPGGLGLRPASRKDPKTGSQSLSGPRGARRRSINNNVGHLIPGPVGPAKPRTAGCGRKLWAGGLVMKRRAGPPPAHGSASDEVFTVPAYARQPQRHGWAARRHRG